MELKMHSVADRLRAVEGVLGRGSQSGTCSPQPGRQRERERSYSDRRPKSVLLQCSIRDHSNRLWSSVRHAEIKTRPGIEWTTSDQWHHPSGRSSRASDGRPRAGCQNCKIWQRGIEEGRRRQQRHSSELGFSSPGLRNREHLAPRAVSSEYVGDAEPSSEESAGEVLESAEKGEVSFAEKAALFQHAFWRFLRPHTIRGTLLGSTALVARALTENPQLIDWVLLPKALRGVLALLCGNGYIVGINQIYDVGIDKINKPFLPIAAGDLSVPAAWGLVLGLAALGVGIASTNFGPLITALYSFGLFLGTIYSVPPFHLKRFAVPAFLIIATVRGFLLNFGVYYATRAALGLSFQWSPSIVFITCFVTVFATVIAITKDLPDIEGDRKFNISTFATKLGVRNISFLGAGLLLSNYVGAIIAAIYLPQCFNRKVMIPAHTLLALGLMYQTWLLDSAQYTKESIAGFYRFIWNLFYSQYILLPFL